MSEVPASCVAWDEDLSALVDQELSPEREPELRAHLDSCARCARRLEELCNVDLVLAGLAAPEVPGDLRTRLEARIAVAADIDATDAAEAPTSPEAGAPAAGSGAGLRGARARTAAPAPRRRWARGWLALIGAAAAALLLAVWVAVRNDAPLRPEAPLARVEPAVAPPEAAAPAPSVPAIEPEPAAAQIAQETPAAPEATAPPEPPVEMAALGLPELSDLEEEDVALLVELDAVEDFDVIANLELLERFLAAESAGGAS